MRQIQLGVIGCGTIANAAHIPSYKNNPEAVIKYFCDIIPERAEAACRGYGSGIAVTDYHKVLEDPEVEAVSICTPNNVHPQIAIDAMRAGKHVLCEKPAAKTYQEALRMQQVQRETGKLLNIGVVNRFNTGVNKIKELIDNGSLGEIYHVYMSFRSPRSIPGLGGDFTNKEIAGGGVLIDWGVHFFDLVMYCLGDPKPLTATAESYAKLGKDMKKYVYTDMWAGPPRYDGVCDVEEFITGMVRTAGPTITFNGAWAQNIGEEEKFIDFLGTKGGVRLEYCRDFVIYSTMNGMLTKMSTQYPKRDMYQNEIDAFLECVKTGQRSAADIDKAVITSHILQALYDSSSAHQEIKM